MPTREIAALPVRGASHKNCVLFLWVTSPFLQQGLEVIKAWGFKFKTVAFTWVKINKHEDTPFSSKGYWTRGNAEFCLVAVRGRSGRGKLGSGKNHDVEQLVFGRRSIHSRKPAEVRKRIVRLVDGPYLELFARRPADGWDAFGNHFGQEGPPASENDDDAEVVLTDITVPLSTQVDAAPQPRRKSVKGGKESRSPRPSGGAPRVSGEFPSPTMA